MNVKRHWKGLAGSILAGLVLVASFAIPLPNRMTPVSDAARLEAVERAKETAQEWFAERDRRFNQKIALTEAFRRGASDSVAFSDALIGFAFRTVCYFENGNARVWTRYAPEYRSYEGDVSLVEENGQLLAVYQHMFDSLGSGSNTGSLVGITVISGPTLIPGDRALPTLEAAFRDDEIPVTVHAGAGQGAIASVTEFVQFDEGLWLTYRTRHILRLKLALLIVWLAGLGVLAAFYIRRLRAGARTAIASGAALVVLLWIWIGGGLQAPALITGVSSDLLPLALYVTVNLLAAAAIAPVVAYMLWVKRLYGVVWYPRTIFFSVGFGLAAGAAWFFLPDWMAKPMESASVSPFENSLINNVPTLWYFAGTEVLFLSTLIFFTVTAWFLFGTEKDQITWVSPLMIAGFATVAGLYFTWTDGPAETWRVAGAIVLFLLSKQLAYQIYLKPRQFSFLSRVRLIVFACFLTVGWTYWFIYTGYQKQLDVRAAAAAERIKLEDRSLSEHLARVLPRYLMRRHAFNDLYEETEEIRQAIKELEKPAWDHFEITLYRVDEARLGPVLYSNVRFRQPEAVLREAEQQLKRWEPKTDVIPLLLDRLEPVMTGFSAADASGAKSGVLAIIRPRYQQSDGPFDAVFEPDVFPGLESFSAGLYSSGVLQHRFFHGTAEPTFTVPPVLAPPEPAANAGAAFVPAAEGYRSQLTRINATDTLVLTYPELGLAGHVYAAVRYFLVLIVFTLLLYGTLLFLMRRSPEILTVRQRLQFRILDSFILSTLVFLVSLVVVTHYMVLRIADRDFNTAFEQRLEGYRQALNQTHHLDWLNYQYDGDYLLYEGAYLIQSSRSQLTRTGRMPGTLPYIVYSTMTRETQPRFIQEFSIAGEPFRAGILRLARAGGDAPLYVVFPAAIRSGAEAEYLYRTTSFLIIVYVFMFGLFVAGAALIARHLSRPLADLSTGLRRVATGEFSATVPVTSQDEVGDLANAYNLMIYKLQDLQKELAEAERQAALSEMARQVAHEIKNPLTPMKLSIQFLQRQIQTREQPIEELQSAVDRICRTVIEQIDSLNAIASDFSRFAKPLTGVFRKTDLNKVANDIIDLYRHDRRITLIPDLFEAPLYLKAIPDEMKRVFINLVKNSDEAMPEGGIIIVRTYSYKDQVFAEVVDNGTGIPVEMQGRIFTPNFSTKTSGTGLGLAICKKVVEAHNGSISFASVPGAGTTFTLVFPAWKETDTAQTALELPEPL